MKKNMYMRAFLCATSLFCLSMGVPNVKTPATVAVSAAVENNTATTVPTEVPGSTPGSTSSSVPTAVPTSVPTASANPIESSEPTATPSGKVEKPKKKLKKVKKIKARRYSTHQVKISWKKTKKAKYYRVYYSRKKNGKYRVAGVTKKGHYLVGKLKNHKKYYFYVQACKKKKPTETDSLPSKKTSMRMKTYVRKTIFAGDSICEGVSWWTLPCLHIGGKKKVVAYKGLNTVTYHTKRIFGGKTGLQKVISEKPYRVYMMLGINEIHFRRWRDMIREYQGLVRAIKQASPQTDIVLCSVSPVTRGERARHKGFWQIPVFNRNLKKMAKRNNVKYTNYTAFLKDSQGYLKSCYATADGYHWKLPAYRKFAKIMQKYDLSLDR